MMLYQSILIKDAATLKSSRTIRNSGLVSHPGSPLICFGGQKPCMQQYSTQIDSQTAHTVLICFENCEDRGNTGF